MAIRLLWSVVARMLLRDHVLSLSSESLYILLLSMRKSDVSFTPSWVQQLLRAFAYGTQFTISFLVYVYFLVELPSVVLPFRSRSPTYTTIMGDQANIQNVTRNVLQWLHPLRNLHRPYCRVLRLCKGYRCSQFELDSYRVWSLLLSRNR
jgi:hypothetical protein